MQEWLRERRDEQGAIEILKCYNNRKYNLLNYDGNFIKHVFREHGPVSERVKELNRLAGLVAAGAGSCDEFLAGSPEWEQAFWGQLRKTPLSFQNQHAILVASPAAYLERPRSSWWFLESARRFGIDVTLLGVGQEFPNTRRKISLVADYLRENPEYRYVVMVDFKDVIFCATLQEMFHKYRSFGHGIVISAQRDNWPLPVLGGRSPETGTSARYLNSGSIFATSEAWLSAWETMQSRERHFGGVPPEIALERHIFNEDQAAWIDLYVNGLADIVLDAECRLFQVLGGIDTTVSAGNVDWLLEGKRILNRETGGRPCLVHGAGSVPLAGWANYILDALAGLELAID